MRRVLLFLAIYFRKEDDFGPNRASHHKVSLAITHFLAGIEKGH